MAKKIKVKKVKKGPSRPKLPRGPGPRRGSRS